MSTNISKRGRGEAVNGDMTTHKVNVSDTESVPLAVVTAVSSVKETDETTLEPLGEEIDTDALQQLFSPKPDSRSPKGYLEFTYEDCLVTISSDGLVSATRLDV